MPNEKAAEPLSEEKLAEFERHIRNEDCVCDYEADALALVAEVRLGREALKALEDLYDGVVPALYDEEVTGTDARSRSRMIEHLRKLPALLNAASIILRKAGRR